MGPRSASVAAWILASSPCRSAHAGRVSGQSRDFALRFSPARRAASLDRECVDQDLLGRAAGLCEGLKRGEPNTLLGPADIKIFEGFLGPIIRPRVDPTPARNENMRDPAGHAPIIDARAAYRVGSLMRAIFENHSSVSRNWPRFIGASFRKP